MKCIIGEKFNSVTVFSILPAVYLRKHILATVNLYSLVYMGYMAQRGLYCIYSVVLVVVV